jgi:heat-inducible transcriptional repressor
MLDERSKRVLCAVVQNYINSPDPVGSRTVAKKYSFGLSPATIRNIMADLEDLGFLSQPHTSAGRVPTDRGYRFYVDSLMDEEDYANKKLLRELHKGLEALRDNIDMLFGETTRTISLLSHYLGVAMSPNQNTAILKKIDLLRYRVDKIAAIMFTDEGIIKNKIISLDLNITQKDLNRIAGYLNSEFSGYTFDKIRLKILKEMSKEKIICDSLISRAINICREAFFLPYGDLFVAGLSEVLDLPDFADLQKIKELSRAIEDKHTIIKLLDKLSESDGVQIIIGSENSMDEMKKLSLVVSTCKAANRPIGVIGIIGPTRMNYSRAISIVDTTAKFISRMLVER